MRGVAYWAIGSGIVTVLVAVAYPFILEWQLHRSLIHFGTENSAAEVAQQLTDERTWTRIFGVLLGVTSVVAGMLLLRRRKQGWYMWLGVCGIFLGIQVLEMIQRVNLFLPVFWSCWWLAVTLASITAFRKSARSPSRDINA